MRLGAIREDKKADQDAPRTWEPSSHVYLDSPTVSSLAADELFVTALRLFEQGRLTEADRLLAGFLDLSKELSAALWRTVTLARQVIRHKSARSDSRPEFGELISHLVRQVITTS